MTDGINANDAPRSDLLLEGNLLGVLIDNVDADGHDEIFERLRPEHFDHYSYREIYAELLAMRAAGEAVDNFTLTLRLRELGKMGPTPDYKIDSTEFQRLTTYAMHPGHASAHADHIIKLWRDRRYYELSARLAAAAQGGREDLVPAILERIEEVLREASDGARGGRAKKDVLRFLSDDECERMEPARGIVSNVLFEDSIAFLYAREGRWKTFLALDWGLCCASNRPWHGRLVAAGPVAYIAAEGARGIGKRIRAWKRHHGVEQSLPLRVLPQPVQLLDAGQVRELITQIREQVGAPVLVVVDTLARSMAGGNENDSKDINAVTDAAYMIRAAFGCCVLVLHHSGKDEGRGMRGSSALRSNADTVMRLVSANEQEPTIKPGEPITLKSEKSKDGDPFADICLTTQLVTWAIDAGDFNSSLVVVPGDPVAMHTHRNVPLTEMQQAALDALYRTTMDAPGLRAKAWLLATGLAERTFYDARDALLKTLGYVTQDEVTKLYTVTDAGREHVTAKVREDCVRTAEDEGRSAEPVHAGQGETPGFMGAQPTAVTAEPIGMPQFRSNGHLTSGRPCLKCCAWLPALPEGGYAPCAQCASEEVH